jgi:hypothetical protein
MSLAFFCTELRLHNIILEDNALQVVKAASSNICNWNRFGQLVDDTQSYHVKFSF